VSFPSPVCYLLVLCVFLAAATCLLYRLLIKKFGLIPQCSDRRKLAHSANYHHGEFHNLQPTTIFPNNQTQRLSTKEFLFGNKANRRPAQPLPMQYIDFNSLNKEEDMVVWLGHSSFFMQLAGKRIVADPVLGHYAAPLPFLNRAFAGDYPYAAHSMPDLDAIIISHDHWDHLDYATIIALKDRVNDIICPLGVGSHLRYWGVEPEKIHELDWHDNLVIDNLLTVHALPARHFSGRGMFAKNKTLWASFAFVTEKRKVFYSGDGGYGEHFAHIGQRFGEFDLAILENGQYDRYWPTIHMMPEQVACAAVDLRAKALLPVHAGRFSISLHSWDDPYQRLSAASHQQPYALLTPMMGEPLPLTSPNRHFPPWWR